MVEISVPEERNGEAPRSTGKHRPSTAPLTANEENCRQVAAFLMLEDPAAAEDAFLGEPLESVLHVSRWCVANADHPDYSPEQMIRGWAKKRGRGMWSDRPTRGQQIIHGDREPDFDPAHKQEPENETLGRLIVQYWVENPQRFVALLDEVEAAATGKPPRSSGKNGAA